MLSHYLVIRSVYKLLHVSRDRAFERPLKVSQGCLSCPLPRDPVVSFLKTNLLVCYTSPDVLRGWIPSVEISSLVTGLPRFLETVAPRIVETCSVWFLRSQQPENCHEPWVRAINQVKPSECCLHLVFRFMSCCKFTNQQNFHRLSRKELWPILHDNAKRAHLQVDNITWIIFRTSYPGSLFKGRPVLRDRQQIHAHRCPPPFSLHIHFLHDLFEE